MNNRYYSRFETPRVKLSREAYENSGIEIFSTEEIPYTDRTGPKFAKNLTGLFVARVKKLRKSGQLHIYELGTGTGILAKRILDLLENNYKEIYDKTILHVSDISKSSITQLKKLPVFKKHKLHVVFEVIDATNPKFIHKPLLVYFTYLLDSLPTRQILITNGQIFDLQFQTSIKKDARIFDVSVYPPQILSGGGITKLFSTTNTKRRMLLAPQILPVLKEKTKFVPISRVSSFSPKEREDLKELAAFLNKDKPFAFCYSYPARIAVNKIIKQLQTGGFLFFSDFGTTSNGYEMTLPLEYGLVIAFPIDFICLTQLATTMGATCYLTSNPPPNSQEMLIDTLKNDPEIKNLFEKISTNNIQDKVSKFLEYIKDKQIETIDETYNSLAEDVKSDSFLITNLAWFLLQNGYYQKASYYADLLLKKYGYTVGIYYYLIKGKSQQELGNLEAAESFFKTAIDGKKGFLAYEYLGKLYWIQSRYKEYADIMKEYLMHTRRGDYQKVMSSIAQAYEYSN